MKENLTFEDLPPMGKKEKEFWKRHNSEYYHYLYRIDNFIDNKFYYGIHSEKIISGKELGDDGYMGSGTDLVRAQKEQGIENFKKTIIKTFSTRDEARLEEMKVVNKDLINDPMCYNKVRGGGATGTFSEGLVSVNYRNRKLARKNYFFVPKDEYLNNKDEYITPRSGKITVSYKSDTQCKNKFLISKEEYLNNKDKYSAVPGPTVFVNYSNPEKQLPWLFVIGREEYNKNKDKYILSSTPSCYKNKDDWSDTKFLDKDDPLVTSGQFIGINNGVKQSKETIDKKLGEKNGSYGTMWITDGKNNKKISSKDVVPSGWWPGRSSSGPSKIRYINRLTLETKYLTKEEYLSLNSDEWFSPCFFIDGKKFIEYEDIQKIFGPTNSWSAVSRELGICAQSVKKVRDYYLNTGYRFFSNFKGKGFLDKKEIERIIQEFIDHPSVENICRKFHRSEKVIRDVLGFDGTEKTIYVIRGDQRSRTKIPNKIAKEFYSSGWIKKNKRGSLKPPLCTNCIYHK